MADPIETLMDEHRLIEKVLGALEAAEARRMPADFYLRAAEFCSNFADATHHAKEEDRLFPMLEQRGVPREGGPIGVMCEEHVIGRRLIARMRESATAGDLDKARDAAAEYASLLRQHIQKEDQVLFAMARQILPPADQESLASQFEEAAASTPDRATYEELAARLAEEARA